MSRKKQNINFLSNHSLRLKIINVLVIYNILHLLFNLEFFKFCIWCVFFISFFFMKSIRIAKVADEIHN